VSVVGVKDKKSVHHKNEEDLTTLRKKALLKQAPVNICKGAAIGVVAILPGISGGVLCVVFGIYKPLMSFLSHPFKTFQTYYLLFIPVFIGWALGFLGLARVVEVLFRVYEIPAIWFFIGLITGTLPSLLRTAGERGRTVSSWIACGISFTLFLVGMFFLRLSITIDIEPSFFWWLVSGLLWGVGVIIPGLSASTFLIYLGLYQPLTAGIADLSLVVLIPFLLGNILVVLIFARLINWLFEFAYSVIFHGLFGIVVASMLAIIPFETTHGVSDILLYLVCFVTGCIVAWYMDKLSLRLGMN